jgi:hypothetical protein
MDVLIEAVRQREASGLALAVWLWLPFAMIMYFHLPPKYHVPSSPAVALILVRAFRNVSPPWRRIAAPAVLAGGALCGILILRADAVLGGVARSAVQDLVAPLVRSGERVWIAGHWGFQWYAE